MRWPSLLGGRSKLVPWLNKLLECAKSCEIKQVIGGKIDGNTLTIFGASGGGGRGWHWASPKKYDKTKSYAVDEIVVVLATNTAVADGALSADDGGALVNADPGLWVALRPVPKVLHSTSPDVYWYHLPRLPMPVPDDPDSTSNYWYNIKIECT